MKKIKIDSRLKKVIISVIIAIAFEIILFNYPSLRTIFVGNINIKKDFSIENNEIKISNINSRITSIKFIYKDKLKDKITYNLKFKPIESSAFIELKSKVQLKNDKQYINFDTHSKCEEIDIRFETEEVTDIENIILNSVNFDINICRIFILFIIIFLILKFKSENIYDIQYNKDNKVQKYKFLLILIVFLCLVFLYIVYQFNFGSLVVKPEEINTTDCILMQTEAFVNKSVALLYEPSEELKNMENPYDYIKRDNDGVKYLYDTAYYDGQYYSYFGIAPILTSVLPFRLITGMYLHTYIFNYIYIVGIAFSLFYLYRKLIDKYVKKISLFNFYLGYYAIFFGANILTLLRGAKYDIVVSSGIMFLLISLNLAMSIYENPKYKYVKMVLLGISTALIVLSKPNLIIYYLLILYFLLISMKNIDVKTKIKHAIFIAIPIGLFAILQMIYNYLRFDNIFEFGAKYQLTGLNMMYRMKFTFGKILAGIGEYIFRIPRINPFEFPFIFINTDTSLVSINEICYENRLIGLIAIPILWVYIFINNILKKTKDKEFNRFIIISIITSIISIILVTCLGGICEVYAIDLKLVLCISAVMLLLKNLEKYNENKELNKLFFILCLITIIIMVPISFTTENNFLTDLRCSITVFLKNLFEFWR